MALADAGRDGRAEGEPGAPGGRLRIVTAGEAGLGLGAWEIFQEPKFVDVYAEYFGLSVVSVGGVLVFARRLPGVGLLHANVYSPEAGAGPDWPCVLDDLLSGQIEILTNAAAPADVAVPSSVPDLHSFIVDLRQGADRLYASFSARARKAIRRAEGAGMAVRATLDAADVSRFHEVLLRVTRGGVVYPAPDLALLQAMMRAGFARLYLIELGRRLVGGTFQLVNRYSHGYVSAFDRHAGDGLPGELLYWGMMKGEIEAGMPFLDLGAQSLSGNAALTLAKSSFSPLLLPAYRYQLTRSHWRSALCDGLRWVKGRRASGPPGPRKARAGTG